MSFIIQQAELPQDALLQKYHLLNAFTDCYTTTIESSVDFNSYVSAFYSTKLFRMERFILKWVVNKPSSDQQLKNLVNDSSNEFAAWTVEARDEDQILMCDFQSRTRSWLKIEPLSDGTRLYFGSAVTSIRKDDRGNYKKDKIFSLLSIFHHWYSKALLKSAAKSLSR